MPKQKKKRLRLPNGFGGVRSLGPNLRKPYQARVTDGWDDEGRQIYRSLGTFETEREALLALAKYNDDPCALGTSTLTFAEVYQMWYAKRFSGPEDQRGNSAASRRAAESAFKNSQALHGRRFYQIKLKDLQEQMDACQLRTSSRNNVKQLWMELWRYALLHEIVRSNQAGEVEIGTREADSRPKVVRAIFTADELQLLWSVERIARDFGDDETWSQVAGALVLNYTGVRITEMLRLPVANIHMKERYIVGGLKTAAGKNRIIPIHLALLPILRRLSAGKTYLFERSPGRPHNRTSYVNRYWDPLMARLEMNHLPHDCRYTCISLLDTAGVKDLTIKRIVGHADKNQTEHYTVKELPELLEAIDLI